MICFADRREHPRMVRAYPVILQWLEDNRCVAGSYRPVQSINVAAGGLLVVDNSSNGNHVGRRVGIFVEVDHPDARVAQQRLVLQGKGVIVRRRRDRIEEGVRIELAIEFEDPLALGRPVIV